MGDVSVERSVAEGREVLVARRRRADGETEFVYARPVGRDAWFSFVGRGHATTDRDPFAPGVDEDARHAVERVLLERGYPVRTLAGDTPPEGQLDVLTDAGVHAHPFHTHPATFVVFRDAGPTPAGPPGDGDVHVRVLSKTADALRVRVDAGGGRPPTYAIREAALFPYATGGTSGDLPDVSVEN